jgi:predicted nuclease with TOPRIM domain
MSHLMRDKCLVCLLLTSFLSFVLMCEVNAFSTEVSFYRVDVTINLTFPEEAHPTDSIMYNITINANTGLTLQNFTLVIKAQVNLSWQEIKKTTISGFSLVENQSLPISIPFTVPQDTNGRLYCFIHILTDQIAAPSSYALYTTSVRTLTYNELLSGHDQLLANYSDLWNEYNALQADYTDILADYQTLLESYNKLSINYGTLNITYNQLLVNYDLLNSTYNEISLKYGTSISTYNSLLSDYNALRSDYNSLNSTHHSLKANYTSLEVNYNLLNNNCVALNQNYATLENEVNDLHQRINETETELTQTRIIMTLFMGTSIALLVLVAYIKRKKKKTYVTVRGGDLEIKKV